MIIIPPKAITVVSSNAAVSPDADNPDYMFSTGLVDGEFLTTQTENPDLLEVEIEFSNCDRVALFNIDAYSIDFELTDDDTATVVQTKSVDLEMSDGEYQQWIIESLYIYANATLKISINKLGSTAKCGNCGIGLSSTLGSTIFSPEPGFTDYSIKATQDITGYTYLNQGNWAKEARLKTKIDIGEIDAVFDDLVNIRGTLIYFDGNESSTDFESLRVLGFVEKWSIKVDNPTIAWVDMTIQGVI